MSFYHGTITVIYSLLSFRVYGCDVGLAFGDG